VSKSGGLKAIRQNLMHSSITITDGIYGILPKEDLQKHIINISNSINNDEKLNNEEIIPLLKEIIQRMEK
jgi:uncharacterized UPF0146 family protein